MRFTQQTPEDLNRETFQDERRGVPVSSSDERRGEVQSSLLAREISAISRAANDATVTDDVAQRILANLDVWQRGRISAQMGMDTENKWKPLPDWALKHLERDGANPLNRNCSTLFVPDHEGKYGGFTADLGWMLFSMIYAMENGGCAEFPGAWGHGCDEVTGTPGWTCFFKPVQQREFESPTAPSAKPAEVVVLRSKLPEHRKMVRRDHFFAAEFRGHRYPRLRAEIKSASMKHGQTFDLDWNADLLSWRLAFRWAFRVNDKVRRKLDAIESVALKGFRPEEIAGAHLRFGDKVGLRPGPKEAHLTYQVSDFAERLALYYAERNRKFPKAVFVASDDYNATLELGRLLGPSVTILTSATPERDRGFSIVEYRNTWTDEAKFEAAVRLWADMEILSRTEVVLLSFQSNIGRTVTLMRFDKPANATLNVDPTGPRCSQQARRDQIRTHNFWLCP